MKLNLKTKLAYGFGGVGDATLYTLIGTFLLFFLTTVIGIEPATAGTIAALGALWESLCGPIVGQVSDHTSSRFGRRKPFILAAAVPLAVITSLLFTSLDIPYTLKVFYYGVMLLLFWTAFAVFFIPYLSWGAELTQDYDERTVLRSYTYVFNVFGMSIGMVAPTIIVDYLLNMGKTVEQGWQAVGMIAGLCALISLVMAGLIVKDKDDLTYKASAKENKKKNRQPIINTVSNIIYDYKEILKLRSIRYIIGGSIAFLIGYSLFCADRMYFFTFNMGLSAGTITFMMLFITFCGVMFVPIILWANKKHDKKTIFIVGMLISAVSLLAFQVIGITSVFSVCMISIAFSAGNTCYWQLVPAMIYDVCEVDELAYNKKRAGAVISLQALSESASQAIGLQLLGIVLQFAGFKAETAVQTDTALEWVGHSLSTIPALFMFLAAVMVFIYPVTRKRFNEVVAALDARKEGNEVDLEKFKKLI